MKVRDLRAPDEGALEAAHMLGILRSTCNTIADQRDKALALVVQTEKERDHWKDCAQVAASVSDARGEKITELRSALAEAIKEMRLENVNEWGDQLRNTPLSICIENSLSILDATK